MLSPALAMMARARQAEVRREAELRCRAAAMRAGPGSGAHSGVADSPSARRLLVSKICELVRLADSLGYKREELVRMIQRLP